MMGKWPKKQEDLRALEPGVHQEGRDCLTCVPGPQFITQILVSQNPTSSDMSGSKARKGPPLLAPIPNPERGE